MNRKTEDKLKNLRDKMLAEDWKKNNPDGTAVDVDSIRVVESARKYVYDNPHRYKGLSEKEALAQRLREISIER